MGEIKISRLKLLIAVIFLITYGSLYPFRANFSWVYISGRLPELFDTGNGISLSDLLSNVVLFMPLGFLGIDPEKGNAARCLSLIKLLVPAAFFSIFIQVLQVALPQRDPNINDVIWNIAGALSGAVINLHAGNALLVWSKGKFPDASFILPALWLMSQLIPFVPSLDVGSVIYGVKNIVKNPVVSPLSVLSYSVSWVSFAALWRMGRPPGISFFPLLLIMGGVLSAQVLVVTRFLTLSAVSGAALGCLCWWVIFGKMVRPQRLLWGLVLLSLFLKGFYPFTFHGQRQSFSWIPFSGALSGSIVVNLSAMCEKIFIFGSLSKFMKESHMEMKTIFIIGLSSLAAMEIIQMWIPGRVPEITDPLIFFIVSGYMHVLERDI